MAWNTTVIILVENIASHQAAAQIGKQLFEQDSKRFAAELFYILKDKDSYAIWYSYQRSKHLPDWIIKNHSTKNPKLRFTLIGTALQFNCGPGGLIRLQDGGDMDSYGITPDDSQRKVMLSAPDKNRELIYHWYKWEGQEMALRNKQLDKIPLGSCKGNFTEKMLYFEESIIQQAVDKIAGLASPISWEKQDQFQLIPSYEDYIKHLETNPYDKQVMSEENVLAYIAYSPIIKEIEDSVFENTPGAYHADIHPYVVYERLFNVRSFDNHAYHEEFSSIGNLDQELKKYKAEIIQTASTILNKTVAKAIYPGIAINWYSSVFSRMNTIKTKSNLLEVRTSYKGQRTKLSKEVIESYPKALQHLFEYQLFGKNILALPKLSDPEEHEQPFHFVDSEEKLSIFKQEFGSALSENFILLGYLYGGDPFILYNKETANIHSVYVTDFIDPDVLSSKLNRPYCSFIHFLDMLREQTITCLLHPKKASKYLTIEIRQSQLYCNNGFMYDGPNLKDKLIEIVKEEMAKGLEVHYAPYWVYDALKTT